MEEEEDIRSFHGDPENEESDEEQKDVDVFEALNKKNWDWDFVLNCRFAPYTVGPLKAFAIARGMRDGKAKKPEIMEYLWKLEKKYQLIGGSQRKSQTREETQSSTNSQSGRVKSQRLSQPRKGMKLVE